MAVHDHASAFGGGTIGPPTAEVDGTHARVRLAFGPEAVIVPTEDNAGFTVMILRASPGPFSIPVAKLRVTFGPDLTPLIETVEVNRG